MRTRVIPIILILSLLLGLTACGGKEGQPTPTGVQPGKETQTAPGTTAAPDALAPVYQRPQGADSVKTLLEKSLDFLHSDCDYSKIADVHDRLANMANLLIIMEYGSNFATETVTEISWEQAVERAKLLFLDAETLRAKDPALADKVMEWNGARDPAEFVNRLVEAIREDFRSGTINESNPNYEYLSQLLTDADKGADYIWTHYPEMFQGEKDAGAVIGLDGALERMRRMADLREESGDLAHFKTLELEYRPENSQPGRNGNIYSYYMGSLIDGHSTWSIDMLYYVENEVYYLIGFDYAVGGVGG
ncbi:MAG: hypothetical protein IKI02_10120 [Oscillospiraceae bacterium]|nr:hypothetical protein [Oscillospiraceae bacterium]